MFRDFWTLFTIFLSFCHLFWKPMSDTIAYEALIYKSRWFELQSIQVPLNSKFCTSKSLRIQFGNKKNVQRKIKIERQQKAVASNELEKCFKTQNGSYGKCIIKYNSVYLHRILTNNMLHCLCIVLTTNKNCCKAILFLQYL